MLQTPARYFPLDKGIYEVAPGLRNFGMSFGNSAHDEHVFQLDLEFERYRANKIECRRENLGKYCLEHELAPEVAREVTRFMVGRLAMEHGEHFQQSHGPGGEFVLDCKLTGETLRFDGNHALIGASGGAVGAPPYVSAFDALCSQVQEDVAVMRADGEGKDWLAAIHLCAPGHWAAGDKIGKNFFSIHAPVADVERMNRAASALVDAMIRKGPYVRFVWGFATDRRLNHHPVPPPGVPVEQWRGRTWDPEARPPFLLRVERQVTWGLPEVNAAMFLIRVYYIDGNEIKANPAERALLRSGLLSMSEASRRYKGLDRCMDQVIGWLDT